MDQLSMFALRLFLNGQQGQIYLPLDITECFHWFLYFALAVNLRDGLSRPGSVYMPMQVNS